MRARTRPTGPRTASTTVRELVEEGRVVALACSHSRSAWLPVLAGTPGPLDAWATLLYNLLQRREPVWQRRADEGGGGAQIFHQIDNRSWANLEKVASQLERPCERAAAGSDPRCGQVLSDLGWWPFSCGLTRGPTKAATISCVDEVVSRLEGLARSALPAIDAAQRAPVTHDPGCPSVRPE